MPVIPDEIPEIDSIKEELEILTESEKRLKSMKESYEAQYKEISEQIEDMDIDQSKIDELEEAIESSRAVNEITVLADEILAISSQTNLLALNASIEAARAGEAGRGFAVVAESIKDLSDKTQSSVNDISSIIQSVNDKMVATGQVSQELMAKNNKLVEELAETKSRMSSVTEAFDKIANNIGRIQEESNAIVVAKDQVVSTVSSLAAASEENAAMSEQISATSNIVIDTTGGLIEEIKHLQAINDTVDGVKKDFL